VNGQEVATLVKALQQNQFNLGMSWYIRPGVVDHVQNGVTYVHLDGSADEDEPNVAIPITTQVGANVRVYCLVTSPTTMYIIGSVPSIGSAVLRLRREATQSIPDAGAGTFIQWDVLDLDVFGAVNIAATPTDILLPVPGWYNLSGRGVFTTNAVSRRGYFINLNGTTAAPGTVGGQSLQAPAAGSAQISGQGLAYLNGSTDFFGARVIQNSGAPLTISGTDGGSVIEAIYLGGPLE
jgi:hypothetical protein